MEKAVYIINGSGGTGKDTVCKMASEVCPCRNISSITPILEIARFAGWDGAKTNEARRLLSRLKEAFTEYNDLSHRYCMQQVQNFREGTDRLLFIHIREPEEIERLKQAVGPMCRTLLIRRAGVSGKPFGNRSDDGVENYTYDCIIENDGSLDDLRKKVLQFLQNAGIWNS